MSEKKRKLIIHIGAHKTGSTAIQMFFYKYAEYFKDNFNLVYPTKDQVELKRASYYGHHYLAWHSINHTFGFVTSEVLNNAFNSFIKDILLHSEKDFLISSEEFTRNYKVDEFISSIKDYFDEIYVLLYIRRQDEALITSYQTGIVAYGYTLSFQDWFNCNKRLFDYWSISERFSKAGCKVIVVPYIRSKFEGGDIILDFIKNVSLILGRDIVPPNDYKPGGLKVNITLPDFISRMIRYYNSRPSRDKVVPVLRTLGYKLVKLIPDLPKTDLIPPSEKNKIIQTYEQSNKLLCEKYLGDEYLEWLNKKVEGSDEEWNQRFGYEGSELVELLKTVLNAIDKLSIPTKPEIKYYPVDEIEFMTIDNLQKDLLQGKRLNIGGIVLLKEGMEGDYKLIVKDEEGEKEVTWGILSPYFAERYPHNPKAKNARFYASGLLPKQGKHLEILLKTESEKILLASITV
ncbi:MAG: hypothetical protein ACK4GE_03995 [Caldimicrobium sp.]